MPPDNTPTIAVIVPTYNERGNPGPLVEQVSAALEGAPFRILFADDSTDDTTGEIEALARDNPAVSLNHSSSRRGLARAVVDALDGLTEDLVVVIDGDLQHPPNVVPHLVAALEAGADVVVASRYVQGGRELGLGGPWRRLVSRGSSRVARMVLPSARRTTDPLSGFFAFRRSILTDASLQPVGFKILLEVLVRGRVRCVVDVPYTFDRRARATSKASALEGVRFLRHLLRLRAT
ncbi:MAG: polyprenol monophosphomannose synthase [Chloroflexota bacterium]|nr:polyprenol monophosphomannose synthase [Chloroflexota bacterium]MDE2898284.1 polyprenol monophosphomannose synthase [Chloroflexota bacterium]